MRGFILLSGLLAVLAVGYSEGYLCTFSSGRKFTSIAGKAHNLIFPCKWHAIHSQRCGDYRILVTPGNQLDERGHQFLATMFLAFSNAETNQRWSGHLSVNTVGAYLDEAKQEPFITVFKSVDYDIHQIATWMPDVDDYGHQGVTFFAKNGDFRVRFGLYDEDGDRQKASGFEFECYRDGPKDTPKKYPEQICGGWDEEDSTVVNQRMLELGLSDQRKTIVFDAFAFDKTAQPEYKDLIYFGGGVLYNSSCRNMENAFNNRCGSDAQRVEALERCDSIIFGYEERKCILEDPETPTPNDVYRYCLEFVCSGYQKEPFCPHLALAIDSYSCKDVAFNPELRAKVDQVCPDINTALCEDK